MTPFISCEGTDCLTNELLKAFCLHICKCLLEESLGKLKWITRNGIATRICKKTGIFLVAKFTVQHLIISVQFLVPVQKQLVQMRLKPVLLKARWFLFVCVSWRKMFSREVNCMNGRLLFCLRLYSRWGLLHIDKAAWVAKQGASGLAYSAKLA